MFRAFLAYPQEALHKQHLVHCVCIHVMSVGCSTVAALNVQGSERTVFLTNPQTGEMFVWGCKFGKTNWLCQYSETDVMHFSLILLRIKGLYMFRALLAHPQQVLHNSTWYIACVLCRLAAVCVAPPEDEQVMLETCRGLWFSINWMKSSSRWFHYTDVLSLFCFYCH
jgi:hypothetical protein